ncbi:hypothetical protein [Streptomyces xiaopingdaonensis]|uniref:hypothetical protein n=1 Tax=Streptomyces xiaopingdaonensis TaxID=1565415 RepID=UPI00037B7EAE|nr:hypothetical protein [Streptomyces xiaopingdaonensis]
MASNQSELAFSLIALASESMPSRTAEADGERKALAEGLESDREALERLDDDHYGGIIDRATWMRQRFRPVQRIRSRQHDDQQRLARISRVVTDGSRRVSAHRFPQRWSGARGGGTGPA